MAEVCLKFGISPRPAHFSVVRDLDLEFQAGQIVLLAGPSGVGKTSLLHELGRVIDSGRGRRRIRTCKSRTIDVGRVRIPVRRAITDAIASKAPLCDCLATMTACGLGEPRLWVRNYAELSDGERFRARLARAMGKATGSSGSVLLCDEF
jgi:ABC-type lipoprotein export system ATPase subunit